MATLITVTPQDIQPNSNYQVFAFDGELDKSNLPVISEAIKDTFENNIGNVIFDFTKLKFVNSEGLGFIVSLHYKFSKINKKLHIIGIQPNIQDIFNLIGIPTIIKCSNTLEEALTAINQSTT
jgi:anti-anti-sigma factor